MQLLRRDFPFKRLSRDVHLLYEKDLAKVTPVEESDSDIFNGGLRFADNSSEADDEEIEAVHTDPETETENFSLLHDL